MSEKINLLSRPRLDLQLAQIRKRQWLAFVQIYISFLFFINYFKTLYNWTIFI